ncbi:putative aspartyl aminopeptidase [Tetrabaena socialis]|uniref:aspartyl aminopeptidase n=1 Tax=Tetrabaena socialis TaxID=47790 RepID=A0A2J7ZQ70_9CHLO|nr:putative aspartyl aminopeptidase [Tetrabaena socialis]|eukprot:PNH02402.1 putative aspartyl aminopeptidase [Tetrabaena socialis]
MSKRAKTSPLSTAAAVVSGAAADADAARTLHERGKERSEKLLEFINYSWTPFHAVEEASRRLVAAGFTPIAEREQWSVKPGGRYFFTRNMSTIVAFAVGAKFQPGNGFYMVGAHTDSPCLKLKPVSTSSKSGYNMINIETYGGGLWYTWFDRDLGLAGRVLLREEPGKEDSALRHRLVKIDRPILRVPMLHDPDHQPRMHGGLVIKHNHNQRYATNSVSATLFREVGRRHGLPVQEFSVRNDMPCGSTIGPILSSNLGCRTADVGIAQLSMHSIREQCGTDDVALAYDHFLAFFREFSGLDAMLDVDSLPPPDIAGTIHDTPCNHMH